MDNKRVIGTREDPAATRPATRWVAAIALGMMLPLIGGAILGHRLLAQDRRSAPIDPAGANPVPMAPPSQTAPKANAVPSSGNGTVGFVTVDAFDLPAIKPIDKLKKSTERVEVKSPVEPSQAVAPPASNRVNPFPLVEKGSAFGGFETPENPKLVVPAPANPKLVAESPKQTPMLDSDVKPAQHVELFKEKPVQPIVLPGPQVQLVAQKDPVPLPLPQIVPPPGGDKPATLPQPRPVPFPGFKEGAVRMPLLGDERVTPLGKTPIPTPKFLAEQDKYFKGFIDPANTLDLIQGRARLMMMKETPKRIQVSDESIVTYTVIDNKEITVLGKTHGTTVLNMWFVDKDDKTKETVLSYLVRVFPDPEVKDRLERVYRALEIEINKHFPDSLVRLTLVGDKVMVTGQAHDIFEAAQILKAVVSNTPGASKVPAPTLANLPRPEQPNAPDGATPGQENYISSGSPSVINMLRVGGVQQVMLRVVVAEVNRSAARSIGLNFSLTNNHGITYLQNLTGGISSTGAAAATAAAGVTPVGNIPILLDNGQVSLSVNALKRMNYAKSLAEPNLVTMNGRPASFLAGGQFPVPVVSGNAVGGLQGTAFVPFGVQLQFTPYITDKDRIRLNVNATVSTRDVSTGTSLGASAGGGGGGGSFVPGLTARTFSSTVEMRDGQTLAVAGLIQTNAGADRDQLPFLGDIPFLNRFTGFDRTSASEQELVILITPELVQPMYHQQLPRLPGSDLFEPSDLEFYLLGRLEGRRMTDFRSPAMTDCHRIRQYNRVEQHYIFGPAGFYNVPLIPK